MSAQHAELAPPERILLAPGPTNLPPRVKEALIAPLTGHKDPFYVGVMDDIAELLRPLFSTQNAVTLALPGTGGAGMQASLVNLVEPGDTVVLGVAGLFGERMVEIARRCGANVVTVTAPWGRAIDPDDLRRTLANVRARLVALVHGETSTGVEQPLAEIARVVHEHGAFLVVDSVATLGGLATPVDGLGVDICYAASQKCLSAPPGVAPITVSDRALAFIRARQTPVQSWYLDLGIHQRYWSHERIYHHTAPVLTMYALREALRVAVEEGLEQRYARHRLHSRALTAGLQAMGLALFAEPEVQLPTVAAIRVPDGVDDAAVRGYLLDAYNIEISGGLGAYAGKMWRIGIMGHSATRRNLALVLDALEAALRKQGFRPDPGAAQAAAASVYEAV